MGTSVLIPWRETPERAPLWEYVRRRYEERFPTWQIAVSGDLGEHDDLFNHGQAYNIAAELAADDDVLILGDADTTFAFAHPLERAVEHVRSGDWPWSLPHSYTQLTRDATGDLLTGARIGGVLIGGVEWEGRTSWSGGVIVRHDVFNAVGRADERYVGHGADDAALAIKLNTLHGEVRRHGGAAVHLWHPRGSQENDLHRHSNAQRKLTYRYMDAAGDAAKVREVAGL